MSRQADSECDDMASLWILKLLSQLVLGSMKEFFLDQKVFEAQLDEILLLQPKEKMYIIEDFDSFVSRNFHTVALSLIHI